MIRIQGWDPVLIISQIISLQTLHYLTLSILSPPFLSFFVDPAPLAYEGGASSVGMLLDWREMAGRSTVRLGDGGWGGAWLGAGKISEEGAGGAWTGGVDPRRGWVIAVAWVAACAIDVIPLYYLIRRPTHILDFSLTLTFIHLLLTTYYTAALPSSLFYYAVLALGVVVKVVWAEQLCVRREMREGLGWGMGPGGAGADAERGLGETLEMSERRGERRSEG